ncbi:MAG TPA: clostripain-related cysteine peptidase [Chroococcales cyanobacterium]
MKNRFGIALAISILTGCALTPGQTISQLVPGSLEALSRPAIGGKAYENFKIAPNLPKSEDSRLAVKLTYLMTDDTGHQSPWSLKMLNLMDDLPQSKIHNVVFRDGGELGDSRLYYIQKGDEDSNKVNNPQSLLAPGVSEVQSNNPKVFSQILGWTLDHYPGQRKYLQLYTHGAGVFGVGCDEKQTDLKGKLLPDDQNIWAMPIPDFAEALRQGLKGRQLDLIYFRACLMGNVEALYELRGTTRYALASEDVSYSVDNSNLWMTKSFDDLASQNVDPKEIARQLAIQAHSKHPQVGDTMYGYTTFAAVDIDKMTELKGAINSLALALKAAMATHRAEIVAAYDAVPTVQGDAEAKEYYQQMRDLWAFTAQLMQKVTEKGVLSAVAGVRSAQEAAMIHEKDSFGSAANGLSILMPARNQMDKYGKYIDSAYQKTRFAKDTAWDDFLRLMK